MHKYPILYIIGSVTSLWTLMSICLSVGWLVFNNFFSKKDRSYTFNASIASEHLFLLLQLLYVTTGVLKHMLINNPDTLKTYTHIIMDEVPC